jgi:hypothetical protein
VALSPPYDEERDYPPLHYWAEEGGWEVAALPRGRRESRSKRLNKNNCEFILDFEFDLFLPTKLKVSCALVKNWASFYCSKHHCVYCTPVKVLTPIRQKDIVYCTFILWFFHIIQHNFGASKIISKFRKIYVQRFFFNIGIMMLVSNKYDNIKRRP